MVAEVIINRTAKKLNKGFDYNIPEELEGIILVGSKVLVPFGKGEKLVEGFVVGLKEKSNYEYEIKNIAKLEENLSDKQISLAKWMANRYFSNTSECIKLMLTPGTRNKDKEKRIKDKKINTVYLKKEIEEIELDIQIGKIKSEKHKKVINFVKDNEGATILEVEAFTDCSRAIVNTLIKNGYIENIEQRLERNPLQAKELEKIKEQEESKNLELTQEQKIAYEKVEEIMLNDKYNSFLLYGVTGSRKNRNIFATNSEKHYK